MDEADEDDDDEDEDVKNDDDIDRHARIDKRNNVLETCLVDGRRLVTQRPKCAFFLKINEAACECADVFDHATLSKMI